VRQGYVRRLAQIRTHNPHIDQRRYDQRLDYEIDVIARMGFAGYFLIVADFIQYARDHQVPVGPGRGSAAGSMVAYSMGITDLDPIEHGLIFERFLNPDRISMPDIDVDFCINGREKVFKYVVEKYGGGDYVAQIITYGKLKTRAVIRDVGRALDIPLREVDAIAKMVPDQLNITLEEAIAKEPRFQELAADRPEVADLLQICRVLEGLPRHASTHAAGVVIGDKPLVEYLPLYRGKKGEVVTQFDMKYVEKAGLVKFDFLGLRNLTVIDHTLALIAAQGETPPAMSTLSLEDPATFRLLGAGDTTGVFQLESEGMKNLLVRLKPASFADVTALVALYRPGPLDSGMVDDFVERKHGRKAVRYLLPELEPILKETYGVILYQEQVMQIAVALASYTMAKADGLRKAMGKKIAAIMAEHRELFMQGARKNGLPEDKARSIFDLMEKFGGYGFNKSHSAAYALIAYQTAYLKAHFPVEFFAAQLSCADGDSEAIAKFVSSAKSSGIRILPPDVNRSEKAFSVDQGAIRFGLLGIKGVGKAAIDPLLAARQLGPFRSIADLRGRVPSRQLNSRTVMALIHSGALDSTGYSRDELLQELHAPDLRKGSGPRQLTRRSKEVIGQEEMAALGVCLGEHPARQVRTVAEAMGCMTTKTFRELPSERSVRICGTVTRIFDTQTKRGQKMAFVDIEDESGSIAAMMFQPNYGLYRPKLGASGPIVVTGSAQNRNGKFELVVRTVSSIEEFQVKMASSLHLEVDPSRCDVDSVRQLVRQLKQYPGNSYVYVREGDEAPSWSILLRDNLKVAVKQGLLDSISSMPWIRSLNVVFS